MSTPDRTSDDQLRLPDDVARRLFARASELDASGARMLTVAQARDAARQAGISLPAFEAALAELQQQAVAPAPAAGVATRRRPRHVARIAVLTAALVLGAGMWFVRAVRSDPQPMGADAEVIVSAPRTTVETRVDTVVTTVRARRPASPGEALPARAPR